MAVNRIVIGGNIVADAEYKSTSTGSNVCSFRIAHNPFGQDAEPYFIGVNLWGNRGEKLVQYLTKGTQVVVDGTLKIRDYEHHGERRRDVEIRADDVQFAGPRKESVQQPSGGGSDDDDFIQF